MASHLLFADDFILFGQADLSTMKVVAEVLDTFSKLMTMQVNLAKSATVFSKSRSPELKANMEAIVHIPEQECPIKYLGLPLIVRKLKHDNCRILLSSLEKQVARW